MGYDDFLKWTVVFIHPESGNLTFIRLTLLSDEESVEDALKRYKVSADVLYVFEGHPNYRVISRGEGV